MFYIHKTPSFFKRLFPGVISKVETAPGNKEIYLTFDDGPNKQLTASILRILEQFNAKASFFCVGENVERYTDEFEMIMQKGHAVGNHGYSHKNGWYCSTREYFKDTLKCQEVLSTFNIHTKYFRPPYGKLKPAQYKGLQSRNYRVVMWDVLSGDFDKKLSSVDILQSSIRHTVSGSIIVFHDNVKCENVLLEVLPLYLEHFQLKGFIFKKLWNC